MVCKDIIDSYNAIMMLFIFLLLLGFDFELYWAAKISSLSLSE